MSGGDRRQAANSTMGTSREPSVTFSMQNEEITYDENHSEQTLPPSAHDRQPLHRATSASNGSPPSIASERNPNGRRPRRTSQFHGSVSNISEFTAAHVAPSAGPLVVYQPDWAMAPPPMLSRAPSMSQVWGYPPPPPMYPPFYFGAFPATPTLPHNQKELRKAMKHAHKMEKKRRKDVELAMRDGGCFYYCCSGVAKLLWIIILITLVGFVSALLLSIYIL